MKKVPFIILLSFLAFACTDDSLPEIPKPIHYHRNPAPEPPEPEPEQGGNIPIVFSGSFGDAVATRTSISGETLSWNSGDRILVLWSGGFNYASASSAGARAEFSTEVNESDNYWAVYPSSIDATVHSGALSLTIPDSQRGEFDKVNIAVASAAAGNTELVFRNLCGLGSFTLGRSDIAKVVFKGLDGETLAGTATLDIGSDGVPAVASASTSVDSITVVPASGSSFAAGTYYFAAIPGALDNGVSFTLTTAGGGTILGRAIPAADELKRSEIRSFGTLDTEGSASSITLHFVFGPDETTLDPAIYGGWPSEADASVLDGCSCNYPVDGTTYSFYLKDLASTGTGKCYWATAYNANYGARLMILTEKSYLGLPALLGYRLIKVVAGQLRRGKASNAVSPSAGIVSDIPPSAAVANTFVEGGASIPWAGSDVLAGRVLKYFTYNLSGTQAGKVYYLASTYEYGVGIGNLELSYEKE